MAKFNLLNYVTLAAIGLVTVPALSMDHKAANEEIENTRQRIMDQQHAGYLGLTQEQRNELRTKLDSSEGTPQDKLKNHDILLGKMHAENLAKEMESKQQAENLLRKSERFMNEHLNDQEIYKRTAIVQAHANYIWLKTEQKQALFQILESVNPQNRAETFKKFDALLKEMEQKHAQN